MSRCDVNNVNLSDALNRDIHGIFRLLIQNYDKVVAKRFLLVLIACRLHRHDRKYRRFYKRQSLKARIHETKSTVMNFMLEITHTDRWTHDLKC